MNKVSEIERLSAKRGSSFSHISFGRELMIPIVKCGSLFQTDYLSPKGKWLHLLKLLALIFLPLLGGWILTITSLSDNLRNKTDVAEARTVMARSMYLGSLIYFLQQERDMSILYIGKIGPATRSFLLQEYEKVDQSFDDLWTWPQDETLDNDSVFRKKEDLRSYINMHRVSLDPVTSDMFSELQFYGEIIDFLIEWMVSKIKESGFGEVWKSLVTFHKLSRCMLDTGVERAYGTMFYASGNFVSSDFYGNFFNRIHRFNYSYKVATMYSDIVTSITVNDQKTVTEFIDMFRREIKYSRRNITYLSIQKAEDYFDNCTLRIKYLKTLQQRVSDQIIEKITNTTSDLSVSITIYIIVSVVVVLTAPMIALSVGSLVGHIQSYSKFLVKATTDLDVEKRKTTSLLYQMLPKPIADRLARNSKVESEFFKSATVMFLSIVNFTKMGMEYSALELTELLNVLYTFVDEQVEKYDIYKVETINETYMVVSGVPKPNGSVHASEIVKFGLDVLFQLKYSVYTNRIRVPIELQLGASSGSVSAGIVGTVMLRYCLFGDTVNTASRMKSYSQPNKLHISDAMARLLKKPDNNFLIECRGMIDVKGKGPMCTYWVQGRGKGSNSDQVVLPGQTDPVGTGPPVSLSQKISGTSTPEMFITTKQLTQGRIYKRTRKCSRQSKHSIVSCAESISPMVYEDGRRMPEAMTIGIPEVRESRTDAPGSSFFRQDINASTTFSDTGITYM